VYSAAQVLDLLVVAFPPLPPRSHLHPNLIKKHIRQHIAATMWHVQWTHNSLHLNKQLLCANAAVFIHTRWLKKYHNEQNAIYRQPCGIFIPKSATFMW